MTFTIQSDFLLLVGLLAGALLASIVIQYSIHIFGAHGQRKDYVQLPSRTCPVCGSRMDMLLWTQYKRNRIKKKYYSATCLGCRREIQIDQGNEAYLFLNALVEGMREGQPQTPRIRPETPEMM
jgi:rRNA maturation endonuclease Nob1